MEKNSLGGELASGVFSGIPTLKSIEIDQNVLSSISPGAFANLTELMELVLANNQLTEFLPEHIASTPKLEILGLNGNLISNISPATFANTPMMDDLRLDVNSISSLPAELLTPIANLTQLEIDNNNITSLPTGFLASVPMLVKLQLAKNPYPVFNPEISQLTFLKVLDMEEMGMSTVPANAFTALTALNGDKLSLQNNAPSLCVPKSALPPQIASLSNEDFLAETGAPICPAGP